jgi:hypothetical protein
MFSSVRRRLTYANVIVTFALVFAMSGGAYAASKYLITSTRQISPKVLKSLKGKAGANGVQGAAGPAGPQGPAGAAGAKGETGAPGSQGKEGPAGKEGKEGKPGQTGFTETLPSGKTETGGWALSPSAEGIAIAPISFNIPLAHALEVASVHFVKPSGDGSTCPGSVEAPTATPGNLCVYEDDVLGLTFTAIDKYSVNPGASTAGAVLQFEAGAAAPRLAFGSWAVTAE